MIVYALICRAAHAWQATRTWLSATKTPYPVAFRHPIPGTRRGRKLWILALIIGLKGYGWAAGDAITSSTESALRLFTREHWRLPAFGLGHVGILIIIGCMIAAWSAYCHHGRDVIGYAILAGIAVLIATAYLFGPVLGGTVRDAYQGTLSWALIGVFVFTSAGDVDPQIQALSTEPNL